MKFKLSQETVRELFNYNPDTGDLTYNKTVGSNGKKGSLVGSIGSHGYWQVKIEGQMYLVHRLIWLYVYGIYPTEQLDHINRIRWDNRIENLREASSSQNMCNRTKHKHNLLGIKGLTYKLGVKGRSPMYIATIKCLGIVYSKSISVSKGKLDEEIIEELNNWLKNTRENLHLEFTNHGEHDEV